MARCTPEQLLQLYKNRQLWLETGTRKAYQSSKRGYSLLKKTYRQWASVQPGGKPLWVKTGVGLWTRLHSVRQEEQDEEEEEEKEAEEKENDFLLNCFIKMHLHPWLTNVAACNVWPATSRVINLDPRAVESRR